MIDTHCHLLPGVDDGPRTESEAVELARLLAAEDVRRIVCTPHYSAMFPTVHADAAERLARLQPVLQTAGVQVETSLAAELGPAAAVSASIEEIVERSIGGRYVLIEVLADSSPAALAALFERLADASLRTIFAHPERCRAVQRRPGVLDPLRNDGALVQVVAPSVVGRWGPAIEATAWRLLDTGRTDLLASDAHGAARRRPHFRAACALIEDRLGSAVVEELTERRPRDVVDGSPQR